MSNDLYKILNNFNKLTEQKPQLTEKTTAAKSKTKLQESIERVQENRPPMDNRKPGTGPHRAPVGLGGNPEQAKGSKTVPKPYGKAKPTAPKKQNVAEGVNGSRDFYDFANLYSNPDSRSHPDPMEAVRLITAQGKDPEVTAQNIISFAKSNPDEVGDPEYDLLANAVERLKTYVAQSQQGVAEGSIDDLADQINNNKQQLLKIDRQIMTIIAKIFQSGIKLTPDQEAQLSQILDNLADLRNNLQGRDVTESTPTTSMTENSEELAKQFADFLASKGMKVRQGPPQRRPESPPRDYSADIAALPELKAELAAMQAKYERLGGSNWQYADRDQNLTSSEREARSMEHSMRALAMRIRDAEKAMLAQQSGAEGMTEEQQDESALQAYLGKKKYGEQGMKALQKAGREGASKEKMAMIRAQHDRMDESMQLSEKAVSKAQQKFMGMVHATKKGKPAASPEVAKVAKGMSKKAARDYASTKHKGLPKHVNETIIRALQEGYSREQIVAYLLEATAAEKEYYRELTKDIKPGGTTTTVHKGHYGTEYQGDDDEDDEDKTKKKIARPAAEKRGRGRPKGVKNRLVRAGEKKAAAQQSGEKRGRGRPPGAKNKPKMETYLNNQRIIAEAYMALVEKQELPRLPAPMEPTYIRDPKTGELVPDIDYKLNPQLRPAQKPAPKPAPKSAPEKKSEVDGDMGLAEMMRLAGLAEKLHGKQHRLDVDKDGKLEKSDFAKLRAKNEEQLDEKMYFDPATGNIEDRTFNTYMQRRQEAERNSTQQNTNTGTTQPAQPPQQTRPAAPSNLQNIRPGLAPPRGPDGRPMPEVPFNEDDMEEGNEFTGALDAARDAGKKEFEVDGRTYPVKESLQLDECGDMGPMANGMSEQEGKINVSTNMSSDGNKSVTVTADGNSALELMQILSLAGLEGKAPSASVVAMEEKDERYHASTTPAEEVLPLETQLKGGDGEVAGKEKKMNKNGSARFSDNPLATDKVKESFSSRLMKEYERIKIKS